MKTLLKHTMMAFHVSHRISIPLLLLLLTLPVFSHAQWIQQGPGPAKNGQLENITDKPITGAINCVTPHPSDADILYIGAVNGGVWRTENAQAPVPTWQIISDGLSNQAIGALEFDPTDANNNTLVVGLGQTTSFRQAGPGELGLYRTTTGTAPWTDIDPGDTFASRNITGIAARGTSIVVATTDGIFRTTNTGTNWTMISGNGTSGLPAGISYDLVADPSDDTILYTNAGTNGVYKSEDTGATWSIVGQTTITNSMTNLINVEIAVGSGDNVFVAIVTGTNNVFRLSAFFYSSDGGDNWQSLDLPTTTEMGGTIGIHPGGQGDQHLSLTADPDDASVVYIGGDRQPWSNEPNRNGPFFPNASGAGDFSGRLFRVDADLSSGSQATPITHSGTSNNSAPHADSRDMDFDANGNLIEGDDGGVYKQTSPDDGTGSWLSLNGNINAAEIHSVEWDAVSNIIVAGLQDNGVKRQEFPSNNTWTSVSGGDGGDIAIDDFTSANTSVRYSSNQGFGSFSRSVYSSGNVFQSMTSPSLINNANNTSLSNDNTILFSFVNPFTLNSQNGQRLLIATSNSGVFESLDQGSTVSNITLRIPNSNGRDAMAYGASDNENIIYLGTNDQVFIRDGAAPDPLTRSVAYSGGDVMGIVIKPNDSETAYVIDENLVFQTTDEGNSWTDITGNLGTLNPGELRSVAYIPNDNNDIVAIGTEFGVYLAPGPNFNNWSALGTNLPRVSVYELVYDEQDKILLAATLGRGAWSWSFADRDPVDVALVMDLSGSMLSEACNTCDPKIDVLKDAVEIFTQLWRGIAIGDDRIGAIYFKTNVESFEKNGNTMLTVIDDTPDILTDVRSKTTNGNELTAMGGGLQTAINELSDDTRARNIILFTDGAQNVDPGVVFPGLTIEDGQYGSSSNVSETNPPTKLDGNLGIKINTIGIGATAAFETQLADIATATDGITKITTAPDEDLRKFYVEELVDVLRDFSPQLVDYRKGSFRMDTEEDFDINATALKVIFKVSYQRGDKISAAILKDGQDVTNLATKINGPFYRIFVFPFEQLNALSSGSTSSAGKWSVRLGTGRNPISYEIAAIADEASIDYELSTGNIALFTGDAVPLSAEIAINGTIQNQNISVTAIVDRPQQGLGTLLSTTNSTPLTAPEPDVTTGTAKLFTLQQDSAFLKRLLPVQRSINLTPGSDRLFKADFTDTNIPGAYRVTFLIEGDHPHTGPFRRTEVRTFVVRFAQFDPDKSKINTERKRDANGYRWTWTFTPKDAYGNYLGPDYEHLLEISSNDGEIEDLRYLGNGQYAFDIVTTTEEDPHVNIQLYDQKWYDDAVPPQKPLFYSIHAGLAIPSGTMNDVFDPGFFLKLNAERFLSAHTALVLTAGSYWFSDDLSIPFGALHYKGYLPIGQNNFLAHGEAGLGLFRPTISGTATSEAGLDIGIGLDYQLNRNSRLSLDLNSVNLLGNSNFNWWALGLGYHWKF